MADTPKTDLNPTGIEITPEMAEAGMEAIFGEPGVAEVGVFFSARDLAVKVYRAMDSRRDKTPHRAAKHSRAKRKLHRETI